MTIETLKNGSRLWNELRDKKEKLNSLKEFALKDFLDVSVPGAVIQLPKQAIQQKLNARISELEQEIQSLEEEFSQL